MTIDLKEIEARLEAISDGPWERQGPDTDHIGTNDVARQYPDAHIINMPAPPFALGQAGGLFFAKGDAEFAVHAPTDLRACVDEIKRLASDLRFARDTINDEAGGHRFQGDCPDPVQPDARDPACYACTALDRIDAALRAQTETNDG